MSEAGEKAAPTQDIADQLWERMQARPYDFDLFQALRRIEGAHPHLPRLGQALRPQDEPVRFAQEPSLSFAVSAISKIETSQNGRKRLVQRVIGLLGPNGALPIHLTEFVRERSLHHGDKTLSRFMDMLLHRFGLLFYRAWTRSQPTVMLDRRADASIERWLGATCGMGLPSTHGRDSLPEHAKLFYAGRLGRQVRDADGLRAWVQLQFGVPIEVKQFVGHWMPLHTDERSRLTRHGQQGLGQGAVMGGQVWDVQHKFRLVIGPLSWAQYQDFLPGAKALQSLRSLVRQYLGFEFAWDLQLIVRKDDVPAWSMGQKGKASAMGALGRSTWLTMPQRPKDCADLIMNVEHLNFQ